jgi:hypothetical protein
VPLLEAHELSVARVLIDDFLRPREERYRRGHESPEGYYLDSFDHDAFRTAVSGRRPTSSSATGSSCSGPSSTTSGTSASSST